MNATSIDTGDDLAVDIHDLLARCLGRADIAERVLKKFRETVRSDVEKLEDAIGRQDFPEIALIAHRVKGAALAVSAYALRDQACRLETSAKQQQANEIRNGCDRLKDEVSRLGRLSLLTLTSQLSN